MVAEPQVFRSKSVGVTGNLGDRPQFSPGLILQFIQIQGENIAAGGRFLARSNSFLCHNVALYHLEVTHLQQAIVRHACPHRGQGGARFLSRANYKHFCTKIIKSLERAGGAAAPPA